MKKWLFVSGAVAIIVGICVFTFTGLTFSTIIASHSNLPATQRCLTDTAKWLKWWSKNSNCSYRIKSVFYSDVQLAVECANDGHLVGDFRLAPLDGDSVLTSWECSIPPGHPFEKVRLYWHRKERLQNMADILHSWKAYVEDSKNLYGGVNFNRVHSKDSALVTIASFTSAYPTTAEVYAKIDSLRSYISSQGATAINPPWLNVTKLSDAQYKYMVALSVNKRLAGNRRIIPQRFVPWKNIEGEVHGGIYTVEKAFGQMMKYKLDYNATIVAMPYQCLITDRRQEQDTTKWVTMVCAPIS